MTITVTANPAENGTAPGMAAAGYSTGSFSGTPNGAGFFSTVTTADTVARFKVVPPVPGATLFSWAIDSTDLEDASVGSSSADFVAVLVDPDDNFVGPAGWFTNGDIFDYNGTDSSFPTETPGLEIRTDGPDTATGWASMELTFPGIVNATGYWIEILAFALPLSGDAELTLGRLTTVWDEPDNGWIVGSVAFARSTA